jgi:hypothetical protein
MKRNESEKPANNLIVEPKSYFDILKKIKKSIIIIIITKKKLLWII